MTNTFAGIITQLEQQKAAIDRALAALREVDGEVAPASAPAPAKRAPKKSARSEGQRKRWAAKKAAESAVVPVADAPVADVPISKSRVTPEGRQKLADAMKKRWAAKRVAAKKAARKQRSATKE